MEFLKNYWYPLVLSSEIRKDKPYGTSLLGDLLVLFRDANGHVLCLHDACPHYGSPLSLGSVKDGNLECPYHGWQFGAGGECKKIPSLPENVSIPKAAKCRFAYPTEEHGGVVWVWAGTPAAATPLSLPEGFAVEGWKHNTIVLESDVAHYMLVGGTLDFSHLPFTHRNSLAKNTKIVNPVDPTLIDYDRGLRGKLKGSGMTLTFEPPCLAQIGIDEPKKPGWRLVLNQYSVPLAENKTRMFMFICRNWLIWNPLVTWGLRHETLKILNEDTAVVNAQYERHVNGQGDWSCSVKSDLLCVRYREWYKREARKFADRKDGGV